MNIEFIQKHLRTEPLYVVERQTSRRGIPNIVSFYILLEGSALYPNSPRVVSLVNIDAELVKVIGHGAKLTTVGRVQAASIHDPYLHTLEEHMTYLSEALFANRHQLTFRVI